MIPFQLEVNRPDVRIERVALFNPGMMGYIGITGKKNGIGKQRQRRFLGRTSPDVNNLPKDPQALPRARRTISTN
jgi:hypothetical protein